MVPMVVLIFVGIAMGRSVRPWWWPACLAAAVSSVALFYFAAVGPAPGAADPGSGRNALDVVGTVVLYFITAYYSFGVGVLWRRREAGLRT